MSQNTSRLVGKNEFKYLGSFSGRTGAQAPDANEVRTSEYSEVAL